MTLKRIVGWACLGLLTAVLAAPASAQAERGKAELKAGPGAITVDYGRPSLKGRDMLAQLQEGSFWRMGVNQATVLTTPVDLAFGGTKVARAPTACGSRRPETPSSWSSTPRPGSGALSTTRRRTSPP